MAKNFQRNEYPRPALARKQWQPLNGLWEFSFDDEEKGEELGYQSGKKTLNQTINVPFAYQTFASGINTKQLHEVLWYKRSFRLQEQMLGSRTLLCFNAVDCETTVWINGEFEGSHTGGYTYFDIDISRYLIQGDNIITLKAVDRYDTAQPRGKQYWKEKTDRCWYHGTSGIWQSVWLEKIGQDRFCQLFITPDLDDNSVFIEANTEGKADTLEFEIFYKGNLVKKQIVNANGKRTKTTINILQEDSIDEIHAWEPGAPNLYDVIATCIKGGIVCDELTTYFAFRKVQCLDGKILLNNWPFYQKLILDQGYWEESDLTPPSAQSLKNDIELCIKMGFNGARKHQKVEDPYYYYYADKLGFVVWAEMPSAYEFCAKEIQNVSAQYTDLVLQLYNHPSVITWVPMNESWGVRKLLTDSKQKDFVRSLYYLTKALDKTRLVSANDGWENVPETDILGVHDYARTGEGFAAKYSGDFTDTVYPMRRRLMGYGEKQAGQPVFMTEYGGIALSESAKGEAWGYCGAENSKEDFYERYSSLNKGILESEFAGYCYTQLTDVKQEVNGLLDAYHNPKFDLKKIAQINSETKCKK